jgi:hypothetical protein
MKYTGCETAQICRTSRRSVNHSQLDCGAGVSILCVDSAETPARPAVRRHFLPQYEIFDLNSVLLPVTVSIASIYHCSEYYYRARFN